MLCADNEDRLIDLIPLDFASPKVDHWNTLRGVAIDGIVQPGDPNSIIRSIMIVDAKTLSSRPLYNDQIEALRSIIWRAREVSLHRPELTEFLVQVWKALKSTYQYVCQGPVITVAQHILENMKRGTRKKLKKPLEEAMNLALKEYFEQPFSAQPTVLDLTRIGWGVVLPQVKSIILQGMGKPVVVLGKNKPPISDASYHAVSALLKAGEIGLSKDELDRECGASDSRKLLRKLCDSDPEWRTVILMPGARGKRYRVAF